MNHSPLAASLGWEVSSLELAMQSFNVEIARLFIEAGADVNTGLTHEDGGSRKPLYIAAQAGCSAVTQFLLANGVDPFAYNNHGGIQHTALHIASHYGHLDVCRHLVNAIKAAGHPPP